MRIPALLPVCLILLLAGALRADLIDTLGEGTICYTDTNTGDVYTIPSAKTALAAVITDGFVYGRVTQTFSNPLETFLEATYIFPLPENGAVHGMCVVTGDEVIWGEIKEKEEAQAIYDSAKAEGKTTALLVQNRPNVFTQKIANIAPGETLQVIITYSSPLEYFAGTYEMAFPTTVGPRYNPAGGQSLTNPVYVPPGTRNGASLDIKILLSAGFSPDNLRSPSHTVAIGPALPCLDDIKALGMATDQDQVHLGASRWITLADLGALPNRDFVLRFDRAADELDYSLGFYRNPGKSDTGYFSMTIFPSLSDTGGTVPPPLEMVIMIDESGSTGGWPMAKEKELARALLDKVTSRDMINVMSFDSYVEKCFPVSVPATPENMIIARAWVDAMRSGGGTVILPAVDACLTLPVKSGMKKVVAFMTDAYVGNDQDVLRRIQNTAITDLSLFSFGIGSAPNRYLIEEMGRLGNGMGEIVLLEDPAAPVIDRFWTCIKGPQLSDISIDFGTAGACGLVPASYRSLYDGQPLTVFGKYTNGGATTVTVTALKDGTPYTHTVSAAFPSAAPINRALPKIWARQQVKMIELDPLRENDIIALGLSYAIMTEYTSFVAVSEDIANTTGTWTSAEIAALWPDGVDPFTAGGSFVDPAKPEEPTDDGSYAIGLAVRDEMPMVAAENQAAVLEVLSNPVRNTLMARFRLVQPGNISIGLYDAAGNLVRLIDTGFHGSGWHSIRLELDLPAGLYFLGIVGEGVCLYRPVPFAP